MARGFVGGVVLFFRRVSLGAVGIAVAVTAAWTACRNAAAAAAMAPGLLFLLIRVDSCFHSFDSISFTASEA